MQIGSAIAVSFEKLAAERKQLVQQIAVSIKKLLLELNPVMDFLCKYTCFRCENVCCDAQHVFYNEVDLFFFVGLGVSLPPFQTRANGFQIRCSYWVRNFGCLLERIFRPYVCTWFICERQLEILNETFNNRQKNYLEQLFCTIRRARLLLCSVFAENTRWK